MRIHLFDTNGQPLGVAEVSDAHALPGFVQLDNGRTFKQAEVETPDDPARYEEGSVPLVTLQPYTGGPS